MAQPNVYVQELYWGFIDTSEVDDEEKDIEVAFVDSSRPYFCEYAEIEDGYCYDDCGPGICSDIYNPPKKASFRIRRKYYEMIEKGEKTEEIRTNKEFWRKQLLSGNPPQIAVFVCGKDVHRRWITRIYVEDAEDALGRALSEQGKKDVLTPDNAIILELGEVWTPSTDENKERIP